MNLLLKLLGGSLGPYLLGGVGILLAGSIGTAAVQGWRLDRAKADLKVARAAQIDPTTKRRWQTEAEERGRDLGQCRQNEETLKASLKTQNAAVDGLKADGDRRAAAAAQAALDARSARAKADKLSKQLAGIQSAATCQAREGAVVDLVAGLTR